MKTENTQPASRGQKPSTHRRRSWIQQGQLCWKSTVAETGNKSATKSTVAVYVQLCCRYGRLCCHTVYQQIANNVNSTASRGLLRCQCVRSQSDTVGFVDFQLSRPCWVQPGLDSKRAVQPICAVQDAICAVQNEKFCSLKTQNWRYHCAVYSAKYRQRGKFATFF